MRNYPILISFLLLFFLAFGACNIINPSEPVPTYIKIDSVTLQPTLSAIHGSVSHKITDVWVYYERQLLGAYALPATVPVITSGKGQLQIIAGIWDNGLSGTRARYPFYTLDTFTFQEQPTQTIHHIPKFTYRTTDTPSIKYFVESFEQGNSFERALGSDTGVVKTDKASEVFEGTWSGIIPLVNGADYAEVITIPEYNLPPNRDSYLELNYKSDIPIEIRTKITQNGSTSNLEIINLKAKSDWTKVYLNLTGFGSTFQYGKFKFIIKGSKPTDMNSANIQIDNFKIIYFE